MRSEPDCAFVLTMKIRISGPLHGRPLSNLYESLMLDTPDSDHEIGFILSIKIVREFSMNMLTLCWTSHFV